MTKQYQTWQEATDDDVIKRISEKETPSFNFKPLNDKQAYTIECIDKSQICIIVGMSGGGKSYCSMGYALNQLLQNKYEKIIVCRPLVTCGQQFGFLPGDLAEKISPFMSPPVHCAEDIIGKERVLELFALKKLELVPLELMRGETIKNSILICDEAQNTTYKQLHMLCTRIGKNSKFIINGDTKQDDLYSDIINPLAKVAKRLTGHKDISVVEFVAGDCVRHPLIEFIDQRLSLSDFDIGDDSADEVIIKNEYWYRINCPVCNSNVWFNDGKSNEDSIDCVKCWKCESIIDVSKDLDKLEICSSVTGKLFYGKSKFHK